MVLLLERAVAEAEREDRRTQSQRAVGGEHRHHRDEPEQPEQHRDLDPAPHDRGVGERSVVSETDEPLFAVDLSLQRGNGRRHGVSEVTPPPTSYIDPDRSES